MFCIVGEREEIYQERIDEGFVSDYSEEVVATFDSREDAERYIRDSRLSVRIRNSFMHDYVFRSRSLLRDYIGARVEEFRPEVYVHNPSL